MIAAKSLNAGYGKLQILYEVDLEARPGEITAVVGPNGSGKSTLLKAIAGIAKIFGGRVYIGDRDATKMPAHERARLGLAYLQQTKNVFQNLTVLENLRMAAYTLDAERFRDKLEEVLEIVPIKPYLNRPARELSGGWRQMVAVAMALMRDARYFLFDEPTAQLSPKFAADILTLIQKLRDMGHTIILAEQNAKKALEISDKAYLLVSGRVNYAGPAGDLLNNKELGRLYLGLVKP
ncbi:ABC transporter ATP-binding protein [Pyrobaculum ferrireducens]|uniref:Branched-chain amino acid transport n=1 Tax=Pyrobaculum ferrireducens TaxID=1104324 RepID=G7VG00_9CREN|nr:ABC transporter ATP-binding protein [Pyrobaculum ferrireducens]AET31807.1 branched-chain amino acid transport [Pyrobaculum ferrireducens]